MRVFVKAALVMTFCALTAFLGVRTANAAGVVGDGTPGSCTDGAIQAAMNAGNGTISFNCGPNPVTIEMTTKLALAGQEFTIVGNPRITLDGNDLIQLFRVENGGQLTLRNLVMINANGAQGAALFVDTNGSATLRNVSITDGGNDTTSGGAIYNKGLLEVDNAFIMDNTADVSGGAIYNDTGAIASIRNSHILGNEAINPIANLGDGGGIYSKGELTIESSTIYANDAKRFGGGLYFQTDDLSIVNATFAENTADLGGAGGGGAIYAANSNTISLLNVTVERNNADSGGGIWNAGGDVTLKNTIVANSSTTADNGTPSLNCDGPSVTSGGHNLIGDGSCVSGSNSTDIRNTNPNLSFINHNGGFTPTLMPLAASPVIDAGDNTDCPAVDQRGRPRPFNDLCDIGAVEYSLLVFLPAVEK